MKRLIFIVALVLLVSIERVSAQEPDISYSSKRTHEKVLSYGLKPVRNNKGKWGYTLKTDDKFIIKPHFEQANSFNGTEEYKVASVLFNGKWGVIDWHGNYVVYPVYTEEPIIELRSKYSSKPAQFDMLIVLENLLIAYNGEDQVFYESGIVKKNGADFLIRKNYLEEIKRNSQVTLLKPDYGEIKKFDFCEEMDERGVAVVSIEGRWGIAYKSYDNIKYVSEGVVNIYNREDDKAPSIFKHYTIITQNGGKTTGGLYIDNKGVPHDLGKDGKCTEINIDGIKGFILGKKDYYGDRKPGPYTGQFLVDVNGKALITDVNEIEVIEIFKYKRALKVKQGGSTAIYNINGKIIIPFTYARYIKFHEIIYSRYLVGVEVEKWERIGDEDVKRYGLYSLDGEEIVSPICHELPIPGKWIKTDSGYILFREDYSKGMKIERQIYSKKNEDGTFEFSIGSDIPQWGCTEEETQEGNIYTYKLWQRKGFLYRECNSLNKLELIICHTSKYLEKRTNHAAYFSVSEFTGIKNPNSENLRLVAKCQMGASRSFVVYDYHWDGYEEMVSYGVVMDVILNPLTGSLEMVYRGKDIDSRIGTSERFVAIINGNKIEKRFSISSSFNRFSKKGDDVYLFDGQNVLCINSKGDINLFYSGIQGTNISDVVRTTDGRYILVGTTKVHGYIDYSNLYVVILDKNGKKIGERVKKYKGASIHNIELSDKEDEFILTWYLDGYKTSLLTVNKDNSIKLGWESFENIKSKKEYTIKFEDLDFWPFSGCITTKSFDQTIEIMESINLTNCVVKITTDDDFDPAHFKESVKMNAYNLATMGDGYHTPEEFNNRGDLVIPDGKGHMIIYNSKQKKVIEIYYKDGLPSCIQLWKNDSLFYKAEGKFEVGYIEGSCYYNFVSGNARFM